MPSRNKYWHKAWSWHAPGVAVHTSGLQVVVATGAAPMASVTACALHEAARGVLDADMPARVAALRREGLRWGRDARNHCPRAPLPKRERVARVKQG